jgi:hypothetical protein
VRHIPVVLFVLTLACAGKRHDTGAASALPPKIALKVTNHHFLDVVIYAVCEGQRTRIGVAGGSRYTRMDVPRRLLGPGQEMRFVGDAIGSEERAVTEAIIVQPGQFIELQLESSLARSSVGVY